jgi:CheY-like chemotaxis protein
MGLKLARGMPDHPAMKTRILVVDDEPEVVELVRIVLTRAGFAVSGAGSLPEAEAAYLREPCELLLVDKNLPGATGFQVIERLREHCPALPAIMMTAYPEPLLSLTTKLQGYLPKPLAKLSQLTEAVKRVLAAPRRAGVAPASQDVEPAPSPALRKTGSTG